VLNSKENNNTTTEQPGGIGLHNVKRRLELIYPGKHELVIRDSDEQYSVNLKLAIDN
jgi:LytS/YehU family sensor histidine kinase